MTTLEIILTIILWIITGLWVAYKRNWYAGFHNAFDEETSTFGSVIFAPLSLIVAFVRVFLIGRWK